ncbi:MAG TPA: four-carbon acid sugar kinase family protein [Geminicoccus sp.]|jgi:uncharacterized protein YgbK (DUF1537 family)|uniref:four-carbon acid sugar kinase family protein n=1 Tax=Geminicoccus sp. TaxID=2024832 RepID=UPI002E2EA51A|nr:four-carbon acid sugar kinase family protein [Geminicoccus sp.]HEX2524696.1 four-carbon acid sugar kinase family protein [Geminicoccus sp.]
MTMPFGRPWLSFYGDDLTGATDALEALGSSGIDTVLFVRVPAPHEQARFQGAQAVGLAGTSRSRPPAWMDEHLPPAFAWLRDQDAPLCHYKVCSTFDSAPEIGSIGRAADIGAAVFTSSVVPMVVGVPQLRRYTFFGHLFADYRGQVHRLDRHPVMSRHPVTPMDEADLRRHLARQTSRSIGLIDLPSLARADVDNVVDRLAADHEILLIDVADEASQLEAGRQLVRLQAAGGRFVIGSSGVEYALIRTWRRESLVGGPVAFPAPERIDRLAVVSGSVSPTTARQIEWACANGFELAAIEPGQLLADNGIETALTQALDVLGKGLSVIVATAQGQASTKPIPDEARHEIGRRLGIILHELVRRASLPRAVVAGGDTSSHALRELDVLALKLCLPLPKTPGSPLCRSFRSDGSQGPELAFKGGQIGADDYFVAIRDGVG